jgi:segregation and condensation protein A
MSDTPQQMDVRLEVFEGPLDLLLHLIKKNDLEISDIPIAQITQEYLSYLDLMKELNLDMAGEFLVMASSLIQIKAQMLLPAPDAGSEETGPDPRAELVQKLLEYQKFKEAAGILSTFNEKEKDFYYRSIPPHFEQEDFILQASAVDLLGAFKQVLDQAPREVGQILREEITIETRIREILTLLESKPSLAFEELFSSSHRRIDLIVTFLALLELIRLKQVIALQSQLFGTIRIQRNEPRAEESDENRVMRDEGVPS